MPDSNQTCWFDGYEGEGTLVLDEFRCQIKCSKMLRILDGHQLRLDTKGGHTHANWTNVVITTNFPPEEWYPGLNPRHRDALSRRINHVIEMN
jgi:hypothetical protein